MDTNRNPKQLGNWLMAGPSLLLVYFLSIPPLAWLTYLCYFPVWVMRIYISPAVMVSHVCPPPIQQWLVRYLNAGM